MVSNKPSQKLTPETAKAIADKVIEDTVVPKKIPAIDDIEAQTEAIVGKLASALLMATDQPITIPTALLGAVAAQLVAYGIRQTEHIDLDAAYGPAWVIDGVRQESMQLPDPPQHTTAEPFVARTTTAPPSPPKMHKAQRAVRL